MKAKPKAMDARLSALPGEMDNLPAVYVEVAHPDNAGPVVLSMAPDDAVKFFKGALKLARQQQRLHRMLT
jgi:hypothetical protein